MLELLENEVRDKDRAVKEFRLADVGDPAVDDDARVHDLDILVGDALEQLSYVREMKPFALSHADRNAQIAEKCVQQKHDEGDDAPFQGHELERRRDDICREQSDDKSENAADNDF